MESGGERVDLTAGVEDVEMAASTLFTKRVLALGATAVKAEGWPTSVSTLPELGAPTLRVEVDDRKHALFEHEGVLVEVSVYPGHVRAAVAHADVERVASVLASLRAHFRSPDPSSAHEVLVTFWTYGAHGPQPIWRSIAVPGWEEIAENYPHTTHEKLLPLMVGFEPARGGQLILWHGRAGTGKTYALRALAWEWRAWCEFHYIVDPDRFFGEHADYLMSVLLQPPHAVLEDDELEFDEASGGMGASSSMAIRLGPGGGWNRYGPDDGDRRKPWKLLMLEDTGELLTADARERIGQGLSRFLNVVDGLIGQGLRVLVLVTTNEEIRTLHPAVARPGRSAANVEFVPLTNGEAAAWLERRGRAERVEGPTTLAALYAIVEGLDPAEAERRTGFSSF